jgi:hypothetical protein
MAATTDMDAFAAKFEDEFSLIACMTSSLVTGTCYIDSGASCHMIGVRESGKVFSICDVLYVP